VERSCKAAIDPNASQISEGMFLIAIFPNINYPFEYIVSHDMRNEINLKHNDYKKD
jgi:hypothetical protein